MHVNLVRVKHKIKLSENHPLHSKHFYHCIFCSPDWFYFGGGGGWRWIYKLKNLRYWNYKVSFYHHFASVLIFESSNLQSQKQIKPNLAEIVLQIVSEICSPLKMAARYCWMVFGWPTLKNMCDAPTLHQRRLT